MYPSVSIYMAHGACLLCELMILVRGAPESLDLKMGVEGEREREQGTSADITDG